MFSGLSSLIPQWRGWSGSTYTTSAVALLPVRWTRIEIFIPTCNATAVRIRAPWRLTTNVSPSHVRGSLTPRASITTFRRTRVLPLDSRANGLEVIRHAPTLMCRIHGIFLLIVRLRQRNRHSPNENYRVGPTVWRVGHKPSCDFPRKPLTLHWRSSSSRLPTIRCQWETPRSIHLKSA